MLISRLFLWSQESNLAMLLHGSIHEPRLMNSYMEIENNDSIILSSIGMTHVAGYVRLTMLDAMQFYWVCPA